MSNLKQLHLSWNALYAWTTLLKVLFKKGFWSACPWPCRQWKSYLTYLSSEAKDWAEKNIIALLYVTNVLSPCVILFLIQADREDKNRHRFKLEPNVPNSVGMGKRREIRGGAYTWNASQLHTGSTRGYFQNSQAVPRASKLVYLEQNPGNSNFLKCPRHPEWNLYLAT